MRCFYTDLLEASYMEKRFGIKYREHAIALVDEDGHDRHYIDESSFYILQPQIGDVIWRTNGYYQGVETGGSWTIGIPKAIVQLSEGARIIMRDGKPFFWPEVENDWRF